MFAPLQGSRVPEFDVFESPKTGCNNGKDGKMRKEWGGMGGNGGNWGAMGFKGGNGGWGVGIHRKITIEIV